MCGIVGATAQRDVASLLIEGLKRLEYRGYDSAGLAVIDRAGNLRRVRVRGKVEGLASAVDLNPLQGATGIAHTRWATHGEPSERNAHPHLSGDGRLAVVHNGIIENHARLRQELTHSGYVFTSETDTEVVVHALHRRLRARGTDLLQTVFDAIGELEGSFALGIIDAGHPQCLVAVRKGSPLVIGLGAEGNYIASDLFALLPVTQRFIFLEEGDVAELGPNRIRIFDRQGRPVERTVKDSGLRAEATDRGGYRHYMQKEIFEQPAAVAATLRDRVGGHEIFQPRSEGAAEARLGEIQGVQIVACGTSFHAGLIARHWLEAHAGLPCQVEVASEFRYRPHLVRPHTLLVAISQSGETADTLAALRLARELGYAVTLGICNVPESSLVRESELVLMTHAGPEIGVASTKAFTTQLAALSLLAIRLGRQVGIARPEKWERWEGALRRLPSLMEAALALAPGVARLGARLVDKQHALFLGRGDLLPVALEGALKLKEITYIHAEGYPAGELKHGPLALVDKLMPVVALAANNDLVEKLRSNLEEVRARGGELLLFAEEGAPMPEGEGISLVRLPAVEPLLAPIVFTPPLQLLAYDVAVARGTDVDQPRNLAKAVTVE